MPQDLIASGLIIQAFSVIYSGWRYFLKMEKLKQIEVDRIGGELSRQIKDDRRAWFIMTSLLFIGLTASRNCRVCKITTSICETT